MVLLLLLLLFFHLIENLILYSDVVGLSGCCGSCVRCLELLQNLCTYGGLLWLWMHMMEVRMTLHGDNILGILHVGL